MGLSTTEEFWALKDVNFQVEAGETLGIIGRNGAGKSTLLKVLSQITPPTTGEIKLRGRVGSLLEVGTGFHQELTGRENIFLNGAILGMPRQEIIRKLDEIVAFSGVEKFLDTPVKHYSSGMYVRLAFSVAAHLEPDILLVDEVLAVGDAEFQKKCLGKMEEATKKEGRTILFVSHNLTSIARLCSRCLLLKDGRVVKNGKTAEVIDYYLNSGQGNSAVNEYQQKRNQPVEITKVTILNKELKPSGTIPVSEKFFIEVEYEFYKPETNIMLSFVFYSNDDVILYSCESDKKQATNDYQAGKYVTRVEIPAFLFNLGYFHFAVQLGLDRIALDHHEGLFFEITDVGNPRSQFRYDYALGKTAFLLDYKTTKK